MNHTSKTFRIFISSTFEDLIEERNALHHYVFPKIKEYCETRGVQFQPIDLRWGINNESDRNHRTLEICKEEIDRCQAVSPNLNFLVLLGSRYGWRPLPTEIPADHFNMIKKELAKEETAFLESWYRLDQNALPAEYCLMPRSGETLDDAAWVKTENQLRSIIYKGIGNAPLTPEQKRPYLISATEHEIIHGLENKKNPQKNALCFFRTIDGLPPRQNAGRCTDLDEDGNPGNDSQSRLDQLKSYLRQYPAAHIHDFHAQWTGGRVSHDHIEALCDHVYHTLLQAVQAEISQMEEVGDIDLEIDRHQDYMENLDKAFTVHPGALNTIESHTASDNRKPLVITGQNGSGKTFLLAQAINGLAENQPGAQIISRFTGATPSSVGVHSLLAGICKEIRRNYKDDREADPSVDDQEEIPTRLDKLNKEFSAALALATADKPLIIVLDALDRLSFTGSGPNLSWLQATLPGHVHIIVSCDSRTPVESELRRLAAGNAVELQPMPREQAGQLLELWLTQSNRTLQPLQKEEILRHFVPSGYPSYLRLAFIEALKWRSFDPVKSLQPDAPGIIKESLRQIADEHGQQLLSNSLAYIAASRNGLSEKETLDLLSLNKKIIDEFSANTHYPPIEEKLPWVVWSRLHYALKEHIVEREADGALVYNFSQKPFEHVVRELFFPEDNRDGIHRVLARYFAAQPFHNLDAPNARKTAELPFHQTRGQLFQELRHTLTDFQFALYKCAANQLFQWTEDFRAAHDAIPAPREDVYTWAEFVRLSLHLLQRGTPQWPSYKIFVQLAWEHAHASPLTAAAEKWLDSGSCHWTWMRLQKHQRPAHIPVNPCIQVFEDHDSAVEAIALAADGRILVSGSHDNTIRVWDLQTRECLQVLEGHTLCVNSVAITPDARVIASAGRDAEIRIWNRQTGECTRVIPSPNLGDEDFTRKRKPGGLLGSSGIKELFGIMGKYKLDFMAVALDKEGKRLVSAGEDGILRLWDVQTGECTREFKGGGKSVSTLLIAHRKQWLISEGAENTIHIWDINTGECLRVLEGHEKSVGGLALSEDEHRLVSVSGDETLRLWNLQDIGNTGEDLCVRVMTVPDPGYNTNVAISNDGKLALTGASWGDFNVRLWDLDTGENIKTFEGHSSPINGLAINATGTRGISASGTMWSYKIGKNIADDTIRVWNLEALIPAQTIQPVGHKTQDGWLSNVTITSDRSTVITGHEKIIAWNHQGKHLYTIDGTGEEIKTMIASPCGKRVFTAAKGKPIQIWDTASGACTRELEGHEGTVRCMALSPDQTKLLAGDSYNDLRLWDIQSGEMLRLFKGHKSSVNTVIFSHDGKKAVSGDDNPMIHIWDVQSGHMLHALKVHPRDVDDLALIAGDSCFVSYSEDRTAAYWNLHTGEFLGAGFLLDIPFNIGELNPVRGNTGVWLAANTAGLHLKGSHPLTWCADSLNNPVLAKHPVTFQRKGSVHAPRTLDIIEGNHVLVDDELARFFQSPGNSGRPSIDLLRQQGLLLDKKSYAAALLKRGKIFHILDKNKYAFYDFDCAVFLYRQLKEEDQTNWTAPDDAQLALAYTRRASIFIEDERVSAAIGDCNRGLQILEDLDQAGNPIDEAVMVETLQTRSDAYIQAEKPGDAIDDLKRALQYEKDPHSINTIRRSLALALLDRAENHTNEQHFEEASDGLEEAFRILDSLSGTNVVGYEHTLGMGYLFRGNFAINQSQFKESIDYYNQCIRLLHPFLTSKKIPTPDALIDAYGNRGISHIQLENFEQGEADLREALKIIGSRKHPKSVQLNFTLAQLLLMTGSQHYQEGRFEPAYPDLHQAARMFEALRETGDLDDEEMLVFTYFNTGCAYAMENKMDDAMDYLKKTVELEPDFIENIKQDEELESIRNTPQYIAWMEELEPALPEDDEEIDELPVETADIDEPEPHGPEIEARIREELENILEHPGPGSYTLRHAAAHLFQAADYERMWLLANDEDYRRLQFDRFKSFEPSFNTVRYAIRLYTRDDSPYAPDDIRVCQLLEIAARLGESARSGMLFSYQWAIARPLDDPRRIADALTVTSLLEAEELLKTSLRLLAIEGHRQMGTPPDQRDPEPAQRIIDHFGETVPTVPAGLDWASLVSFPTVFQLVEFMHRVFPGLDLFPILKCIAAHRLNFYSGDSLLTRVKQIITGDQNYQAKAPLVDLMVRIVRYTEVERKLYENLEFLAVAARLYALTGEHDSAVQLAGEVLDRAEEITDLNNKEQARRKITAVIFLVGQEEQAFELIEKNQINAFKANHVSDIAACLDRIVGKTGANGIIDSFLALVENTGDFRSWQLADAYKSAAAVLAGLGQIPQALELTEKIDPREFPYQTGALFEIAKVLHHNGELQQSQDILERAVTIAFESPLSTSLAGKDNQERTRNTYAADIAGFLAGNRDFAKALDMAARIHGYEAGKYKNLALKFICAEWLKHNDIPLSDEYTTLFRQAFDLAKSIGDKSDKIEVFTLLLLVAPPQLTQMIQTALDRIKGSSPHDTAVGKVVILVVKHNRYSLALDLVNQIREPWEKFEAMEQIARSLQHANHMDSSSIIKIAGEFIACLEGIPYHCGLIPVFLPLAAVLSPLLRNQASLPHRDRLLALAASIERTDERIAALAHLVPLFTAHPEPWVQALHVSPPGSGAAPGSPRFYQTVEKRCRISAAYFNSPQPQHAWTLLQSILGDIEACTDETEKSKACEAVLETLAPVGYFQRPFDLFPSILDIAGTFDDRSDIDDAVSALVSSLPASTGLDTPGAYQFLSRLIDQVKSFESEYDKSSVLKDISYYLRDASHLPGTMDNTKDDTMDLFERLLQIAGSLDDEDDIHEGFAVIAGCIAGAGFIERAFNIASQIPEDEYKAEAVQHIFSQSAKWPQTEKEKIFTDVFDIIGYIGEDMDRAQAVLSVIRAIEDDPGFPGLAKVLDKIFSLLENQYEEIDDPTGKTRLEQIKGVQEELDELRAEADEDDDEYDDEYDDDFDDENDEDNDEEREEDEEESGIGTLLSNMGKRLSRLGKLTQSLYKLRDIRKSAWSGSMDERFKGNFIHELTALVLKSDAIPNREEIIERALTIAREFDDSAWKDNVSYKKASILAQQGNYEVALGTVGDIGMEGYKAMALGEISCYFAQAGEHAEAKKTLRRAMSIAEKIKSANTRPFVQVAAAMAQAGNVKGALYAVEQINEEDYTNEALYRIARIFFHLEDDTQRPHAVTRTLRLTHDTRDFTKTDIIETVLKCIEQHTEQSGVLPGVHKIYLALIHSAGHISDSDSKSSALQQLPGPIFRDVELAGLPRLLSAFIRCAGDIVSGSERHAAMAAMAAKLANHPEIPVDFMSAPSIKNTARSVFIAAMQEQALEKNNPAALRDTLPIYPFNTGIAQESMFSLLLLHVQSLNLDMAAGIAKYHPQLGDLLGDLELNHEGHGGHEEI